MGSGKLFLAAALVVGAGGLAAVAVSAANERSGGERLDVEVAEVGSRFRSDAEHVDADGLATRGAVFIAEGYIYPAGTLTCDEVACDGVLYDADGTPSPQFPDKVLGTWICTGTHVEDIAAQVPGPVGVTTQVFDLGSQPGADTVVSTGFEFGSIGVSVDRAVTGGTGEYAAATGVQAQTLLGFNNIGLTYDGQPWIGVTLSAVIELE
jgi:hypothetical protein